MPAKFFWRSVLPLLYVVTAALPFRTAATQNLSLQWDSSTDPGVAKYRLYIGQQSRGYTQSVLVSVPATSAVAQNLVEGQHYYFAATAINTNGLESGFSAEVEYVVPVGNAAPTLGALGNVALTQNAGISTISLSGIGSGSASENQTLVVTASSGNGLLVPTPLVFYSSPQPTGIISLKPAANAWGTAIITVAVNDGQPANNITSQSFSVIVNNPPTLDPLNNLSVNQNAPAQSISLSGISSGASNEAQTLRISAVSSNPGVIPAPTVFYASPNSTGVLSFTPVTGAAGSAVITVTVNDGQAANNTISRSFTVTVNGAGGNVANVAPTLNAIGNVVLAQNAGISMTISGITSGSSTENQPLTVTAISSNPALIPNPVVTYTSPNTTGILSLKPAANSSGTVTITVTVSDGQASNGKTSRSFTVLVNNAPTLSALSNLGVAQNAPAQTVSLSGITSGATSEAQTLRVTAVSSNPALIPNPVVSYTSPNTSGTLSFSPTANSSGTATITVTVSDGQTANGTTSRSFTVLVNNPPTLNPLSNLSVTQNAPAQTVSLSGITSGAANEAQTLRVTAVSSNPVLIPNPAVSYTSPNTTGTLSFTPAANSSGTATITVTVSDGQTVNGTISRSFTVLVNNPPTLSPLNNLSVTQNGSTQTASLSGITSGATSEAQTLQVTAVSSDPSVVAAPTVFYASPNSTGVVSFRPAAGAVGSATITVTVNDGQAANNKVSRSFTVTVNANVPPTVNPIGNVVLAQNTIGTVSLSGITSGSSTENQPLTVTATSSNPTLVPNPVVSYTSPASTGVLTISPAPNSWGTATITVTVSDGQASNGTISRSFTVMVNNAPTLNPISNMTIAASSPSQTVSLSGISSGAANEVQSLTVTASSSNTGLIPGPTIFYASPNSTAVLLFAPVANVSGSATITVSVKDGQAGNGVISRSFLVTVSPPVQSLAAFDGSANGSGSAIFSQAVASPDSLGSSFQPATSNQQGPSGLGISGLTVSSSDARTLVLTWETDEPATCFLEYGATDSLEWISDSTVGTTHIVVLKDLEPGTTYYMRVQASDAQNRFAVSEVAIAKTPPVNVLAWPAESAKLDDLMRVDIDLDSQDETYIAAAAPGSGAATFHIQFPEGMTYRVWCRAKTPAGDGTLSFSIDGGAETLAVLPDDGSGRWGWVSLEFSGAPLTFLANDGAHQITFRGITGDARLDEVCISNDPEWRPLSMREGPALSASRGADRAVDLSWSDPWSNADHYAIESSTDGVNFSLLETVSATTRWYRVFGADALSASYRVYALDALDRSADSAIVSVGFGPDQPPTAPESLSATVSENQALFTWTDRSVDETGFTLERSSDRINFQTVQTLNPNSTSAMDTPPGPGLYFYRVKAVNNSAKSDPTNTLEVLF